MKALAILFLSILATSTSFAWFKSSNAPDPKEHLFSEFMDKIVATHRMDAPPDQVVNSDEEPTPFDPESSVILRGRTPESNQECYIIVDYPTAAQTNKQYDVYLAFYQVNSSGQTKLREVVRESTGDYIYEQIGRANKRRSTPNLMLTGGLRISLTDRLVDVAITELVDTKIRIPNLDFLDDRPAYLRKKAITRCIANM